MSFQTTPAVKFVNVPILKPTASSSDTTKKDDSDAPTTVTVKTVVIPFPKDTVAIIFGQMTAAWAQRFTTYLLDKDDNVISTDPKVIWDSTTDHSRFDVTSVVPASFSPPDKNVFSISKSNVDRKIAVHCQHKKTGESEFKESDPQNSFNAFKIGGKHAISFTMVNAEDGGDSDYHDTVVGVAVCYLTA